MNHHYYHDRDRDRDYVESDHVGTTERIYRESRPEEFGVVNQYDRQDR